MANGVSRKNGSPKKQLVRQAPRTAVMIDGSYFLKRFRYLQGAKSPKVTAESLHKMALEHSNDGDLYRIFYYDCPPLDKKAHNPVNQKAIDFSKTPEYQFRMDFLTELKRKRKVAIRLGALRDGKRWAINPDLTKKILSGKTTIGELTETDVIYDCQQKGVDMKLGLDIASLAYKKMVNRIVLVTGDSDFVPAAKLARKEGIDFILNPMWGNIKDDLFEHIDGLQCPIPKKSSSKK